MIHRIYPHIRTPEDLGIVHLGDPKMSIVPVAPEYRIDRAEYGCRLAEAEGGRFTPLGYVVPIKHKRRKTHAA